MAELKELIEQIADKNLRERIGAEIKKLEDGKKFGLVYENHLPERTALYGMPIGPGIVVARKTKPDQETFHVVAIDGDKATVCNDKGQQSTVDINELVAVVQFGKPIYPCLRQIGCIENAPDDKLHHVLIEADNYHALQLLDYIYCGQVDCIYIDPPYNTGARDWKYNNDYVDAADKS